MFIVVNIQVALCMPAQLRFIAAQRSRIDAARGMQEAGTAKGQPPHLSELPVLNLSKGFTSGFLTKSARAGGSGGGVGNRPADHN